MLSKVGIVSALAVLGFSGKHEGGHGGKHEGGKKHDNYGVGYVEEGGIVGYSCHEGFVPQGEGPGMMCIHKEKMGLLPVCPVGILEGEKCLLREPALFSCPPGFVSVGGYEGKKDGGKKHGHGGHGGHGGKKHGGGPLCMKVDRIPFEFYCPGGSILTNGQCLRKEIAPATMICPLSQYGKKHHGEGKHGEGKKHSYVQPACVETIDVPPVLTCPPNLQLEGNSCIGVGEGPCPMPMPTPLVYDHGKKHHEGGKKHRGLQEAQENDSVVEGPLSEEESQAIAENVAAAEGAGAAERAGGSAESESEGRALQEVEEEDGEASELRRELGEKKHGGYGYGPAILPPVPSKMKMCTLEIIEPAIPACPPGSIEAGGYGGHEKKKKHGHYGGGLSCIQTVDVPLQPYCPMAGAILNPDTMTCASHIYEAELTKCPLGFEPCDMGGKKHHHSGGGKKDKHGGGYGLPGYEGGCCAVQYADPMPGCPAHAMLLGGQCIIKHAPVFECPHGAIRDGEFCYLIQTKPPKIHYQINVTTKAAPPVIESHHKKHKKHH